MDTAAIAALFEPPPPPPRRRKHFRTRREASRLENLSAALMHIPADCDYHSWLACRHGAQGGAGRRRLRAVGSLDRQAAPNTTPGRWRPNGAASPAAASPPAPSSTSPDSTVGVVPAADGYLSRPGRRRLARPVKRQDASAGRCTRQRAFACRAVSWTPQLARRQLRPFLSRDFPRHRSRARPARLPRHRGCISPKPPRNWRGCARAASANMRKVRKKPGQASIRSWPGTSEFSAKTRRQTKARRAGNAAIRAAGLPLARRTARDLLASLAQTCIIRRMSNQPFDRLIP